MIIPILSLEQEEELKTYCQVNDWSYTIEDRSADHGKSSMTGANSVQSDDNTVSKKQKKRKTSSSTTCTKAYDSLKLHCERPTVPQPNVPGEIEEPALPIQEGECRHCLCAPCITTFPQAWLGLGQAPRPGNNGIRKKLYKHYWRVLHGKGLWMDVRYLQRRKRLLDIYKQENADNEAIIAVGSMREIIPDCVLDKVRNLYPNPKSVPYMGHRWH